VRRSDSLSRYEDFTTQRVMQKFMNKPAGKGKKRAVAAEARWAIQAKNRTQLILRLDRGQVPSRTLAGGTKGKKRQREKVARGGPKKSFNREKRAGRTYFENWTAKRDDAKDTQLSTKRRVGRWKKNSKKRNATTDLRVATNPSYILSPRVDQVIGGE